MNRITMAALAIVASVTLAACGSSSTTTVTEKSAASSAAAPTTTTTAAKASTAYDQDILTDSQDAIKKKLRGVAKQNPGDMEDVVSNCVADNDRNYTCSSTLTLSSPDGAGGKLCTQIDSTQRGNVDPDGSYVWKNTGADSGDPYSC